MTSYLLLTLLSFAAIGVTAWLLRPRRRAAQARLQPCIVLDQDAQSLYTRLRTALPQYLVLPHVSLGAFIEAKAPRRDAARERQRELACFSADFLICGSDYRVVAAVELEDVVRGRQGREAAAALLREASVPLLRWTTVNLPTVRDIQEAVAELETLRLIHLTLDGKALPKLLALNEAGGRREPRL